MIIIYLYMLYIHILPSPYSPSPVRCLSSSIRLASPRLLKATGLRGSSCRAKSKSWIAPISASFPLDRGSSTVAVGRKQRNMGNMEKLDWEISNIYIYMYLFIYLLIFISKYNYIYIYVWIYVLKTCGDWSKSLIFHLNGEYEGPTNDQLLGFASRLSGWLHSWWIGPSKVGIFCSKYHQNIKKMVQNIIKTSKKWSKISSKNSPRTVQKIIKTSNNARLFLDSRNFFPRQDTWSSTIRLASPRLRRAKAFPDIDDPRNGGFPCPFCVRKNQWEKPMGKSWWWWL